MGAIFKGLLLMALVFTFGCKERAVKKQQDKAAEMVVEIPDTAKAQKPQKEAVPKPVQNHLMVW